MDDSTTSILLQGCKLAKELESSIPNSSQQPEKLSKLVDDIIRVFVTAKERLNIYFHHHQHQDPPLYPAMLVGEAHESSSQQHQTIEPILQEWLRTGSITSAAAMELFQTQLIAAGRKAAAGGLEMGSSSSSGGGGGLGLLIEFGGHSRGDGQAITRASDSAVRAPSSQRQQRRREGPEKRTERVPAPWMGNTDVPPDDGFTWRKYGQKEILNSKFPRSYYRCTHQKLYQCSAKKQVQRLDDEPNIFQVTYRGDHTCHMSATAPSVLPPPSEIAQEMSTHVISSHQPPLAATVAEAAGSIGGWLEFSLGAGGTGSSSTAGGSGGAGPSHVRYRDVEFPVTDMADAMFNSGSSGSSMELIFTPMEEKSEPGIGDKKK